MDFCTNILNYSELMSTIVFHRKWNRTSSTTFIKHGIINNFENDDNFIWNAIWMQGNGKYIIALVVLTSVFIHVRLKLLKQQDQEQAYTFADYLSWVKLFHWNHIDYRGIGFSLSCFIVFMTILPLLVIIWLSVLSYRQYIYYIIRVSSNFGPQ